MFRMPGQPVELTRQRRPPLVRRPSAPVLASAMVTVVVAVVVAASVAVPGLREPGTRDAGASAPHRAASPTSPPPAAGEEWHARPPATPTAASSHPTTRPPSVRRTPTQRATSTRTHASAPTSAPTPLRERARHTRPPTQPSQTPPRPVRYRSPAATNGYGCAAALHYLAGHAAPGFRFACPGNAWGHQAMTCVSYPPYCARGQRLIAIAVPCPAAYMNEASNSWVLLGLRHTRLDPYGYCH